MRHLTIMSTTKIAMLQRELPRERKFVKDSCPGVSMTSNPGILYSCPPSCMMTLGCSTLYKIEQAHPVHNSSFRHNCINREIGCPNLLCDTTCFTFLNVSLPNLNSSKRAIHGNTCHPLYQGAWSFRCRRDPGYSK